MMDELLEQFLIEGRDLLAQASGDLAVLCEGPLSPGAIDSAFRAIHTLKGSVGIFPLGPAERVLHAAEDVLERARKGVALDRATIAALVGCIDLVDRLIDEIERSGTVSAAADREGEVALERLSGFGGSGEVLPVVVAEDWSGMLVERDRAVIDGAIDAATGPLVAFRYTPASDCFFRGDDPLAIVAGVPGLLSLAILPITGDWPRLDSLAPFECASILEGISSASIEDVRSAFRLVADQVSCQTIQPRVGERSAEPSATDILRVEASRIDALADGLGELIVAANSLAPIADHAARHDRALAGRIRAAQAEIEGRIASLHRGVGRVRMVPLAPTLRRLPRLVREIAEGLDRRVSFSMSGESLEVDKQIADALFEPMLHLVRNALDHGIEDAQTRERTGKPAEGTVTLAARRDGDGIVITLADDGAGMDPVRLRATAVERGLITEEAARELSDAAAFRLIFAPGFSTASATTALSGRGVGMDAVQAAVQRLRGTISIDSTVGAGTCFALRLPASALTTRLLVVEAGSERYGIALDQIVETVRLGSDALVPVGLGLACVLRGRTIPVLSLPALLGLPQISAAPVRLVITQAGGERVALRVDGLAERLDTVVRPASGILARAPGIAGSALLGDGGVLLVLDLAELAA